jgi:hypothetical protein
MAVELTCTFCSSSNVVEVEAEACVHFPGLAGLAAAPILAFPKALICLQCGAVWFNLTREELEEVRNGAEKVRRASA